MGQLYIHKSYQLMERLCKTMPGGNTRTGSFYAPFPLALSHGEGFRIWDIDGNEFIDLLNNYAALVHGHGHPAILEAITKQAHKALVFPAPSSLQAELSERICSRISSIERLRFTNSGTEAIMLTIRVARVFTGRDEIVMADQGYHGSWEQVSTGYGTAGIPGGVKSLAHLVRYNDVEALESVMKVHGSNVAAILLEPVLGAGGIFGGTCQFFAAARRLADEYGALLILDEVITARLALGGYQSILGVRPDITVLGKLIGGGLPVGAFGGRSDIMDLFDPQRAVRLRHDGTFNGNPLSMAAGCVSLDLLTESEIERINSLGSLLGARLTQGLYDRQVDGKINVVGSLIQLHIPANILAALHLSALEHGLYVAPRIYLNISTVMNKEVVDTVADRLLQALDKVLEQSSPIPSVL